MSSLFIQNWQSPYGTSFPRDGISRGGIMIPEGGIDIASPGITSASTHEEGDTRITTLALGEEGGPDITSAALYEEGGGSPYQAQQSTYDFARVALDSDMDRDGISTLNELNRYIGSLSDTPYNTSFLPSDNQRKLRAATTMRDNFYRFVGGNSPYPTHPTNYFRYQPEGISIRDIFDVASTDGRPWDVSRQDIQGSSYLPPPRPLGGYPDVAIHRLFDGSYFRDA